MVGFVVTPPGFVDNPDDGLDEELVLGGYADGVVGLGVLVATPPEEDAGVTGREGA